MFKDRPFEFLTGVSGAMEIARASGAANIGVLADSFHLFCSGSTPEDIPALASGEVKAVHINDAPHDDVSTLLDPDRVMPGDGVIPLTRFLQALDEAGYAGPAEVELFNPKYREIDPLDAATEARVKAERRYSNGLQLRLGPGGSDSSLRCRGAQRATQDLEVERDAIRLSTAFPKSFSSVIPPRFPKRYTGFYTSCAI